MIRRPALTFLVALVLTACGSPVVTTTTTTALVTTTTVGTTIATTTPTTAVVTIPRPTDPLVVWVADQDLVAPVTERAAAYLAATGVVVEVRSFEGDHAALLAALLAGTLDGPADIYIGPHTWLDPLAEAGLAEPVALGADLLAPAVEALSPRGYALGVPLAVDGVVQARNRALMPEPPTAVEEIPCPDADSCLLLPADGDADLHYPFLVAAGGYLFAPDPQIGYDRDDVGVAGDGAIAGITVFADLLGDGTIEPVADASAAASQFTSGSAALVWVRASQIAVVQASGMDISIEGLPTIAGNPAVTAFRVLTAFVNPFGAAKSEAVEFASEWLGDPSGSAAFALATGTAPVWPSVASSTAIVVQQSVAAGDPVPPVADIDRIWFELGDAFRRIYDGTSVTDALFGAQDDIG